MTRPPSFHRSEARALMHRSRILIGSMAVIAATAACSGEEMKVGEPPAPARAALVQPGDVYTGYVERWSFASGSDRMAIHFTSATTGTVWLGTPPDGTEPPVDPTRGWPEFMNTVDIDSAPWGGLPDLRTHAERYLFTMHDVSYDETRLRFAIDLGEYWGPWCARQTSYLQQGAPQPVYGCLPNLAAEVLRRSDGGWECRLLDPETAVKTPTDCGLMRMCRAHVCSCNASGCSRESLRGDLHFDMRLAGRRADGSSDIGNVRLERL